MNITGIDKIVYGVEDIETSRRFLDDWGLTAGETADLFTTLDRSEVMICPLDDAELPPAIEPGSTLRRVVWGVEGEADLEALRARIHNLPSFAEDDEGPSCTDPNGLRISFRISRRKDADVKGAPVNVYGHKARVDQRSPVYERAHPVRIGHVVFFTPDVTEVLAFYTDVLGFLVSDSYPGSGYFLRCAEEGGHHDLFLLQTPDGKKGLNHVAFTARDIEEVLGGGIYISGRGWKTQLGPGRHPVSSAYFWYVENPCGGLAEYYTNEDFCTADWQPEEWQRSNQTFAEWAIAGGIDAETRRQSTTDP